MEPEHYELLASNLKNRVLTPLSDNYNTWCCGMIAKHLQLTPDDCLADIGGGTGLFTELLRTFVDNPKYEWICADPSENMLLVAQSRKGVKCYQNTGSELTKLPLSPIPNKILLKEVVHHFKDVMVEEFKALFDWLPNNSRVLILTREKRAPFPFFEAAHQVWSDGSLDHVDTARNLEKAGFQVEINFEELPLPMPKEKWFHFVRNRIYSNLSHFTDEELEVGIKELDAEYANSDAINFSERFAAILGTKIA